MSNKVWGKGKSHETKTSNQTKNLSLRPTKQKIKIHFSFPCWAYLPSSSSPSHQSVCIKLHTISTPAGTNTEEHPLIARIKYDAALRGISDKEIAAAMRRTERCLSSRKNEPEKFYCKYPACSKDCKLLKEYPIGSTRNCPNHSDNMELERGAWENMTPKKIIGENMPIANVKIISEGTS